MTNRDRTGRSRLPQSDRWTAYAINPNPPPSPDPEPPPDDDDFEGATSDQQMYWTSAAKSTSQGAVLVALGRTVSAQQGSCHSGLFATHDGLTKTSGSAYPDVMQQVARNFEATKGKSGPFWTYMAAPMRPAYMGGMSVYDDIIDQHIYFAWLSQDQYDDLLKLETDSHAQKEPMFIDDVDHHTVLEFYSANLTMSGPDISASGSLTAHLTAGADAITWIEEPRVTLFGQVGLGSSGTPRSWATTVQSKWNSTTVRFDFGLTGTSWKGAIAVGGFVAGWGKYKIDGSDKVFGAVTPPMLVGNRCRLPSVGHPDGKAEGEVVARYVGASRSGKKEIGKRDIKLQNLKRK